MILFSTVEQSFTVPGRGRIIVPATVTNSESIVRNSDVIQLRHPNGTVIDTCIVSVELVKDRSGSRLALLLPIELPIGDVAPGMEIWVNDGR